MTAASAQVTTTAAQEAAAAAAVSPAVPAAGTQRSRPPPPPVAACGQRAGSAAVNTCRHREIITPRRDDTDWHEMPTFSGSGQSEDEPAAKPPFRRELISVIGQEGINNN